MVRLLHRTEHGDTEERTEVHEDLPELPEGVTVPDDISGLELVEGAEPTGRATRIRWLPWAGLAAVVVIGGLALVAVIRDDGGSEPMQATTSYQLVQQSIDEALARQQLPTSSYAAIQQSIDEALARQQATATTSYQLVQRSIDEALARQQATATMSYRLVQQSIDEALAAQQAAALGPNADLAADVTVGEVPPVTSSYAAIQQSIDEALARQQATATTSYRLVQQSIEDALAELQGQ
jgi:hypothetical protein